MARQVGIDRVFNTLLERTSDNTRLLKQDLNQRRNGMEDLYGQPFIVYGDENNPASFWISISPDMVYLERYAFKISIEPYQTTVTGGTDSVSVTVDNRNLAVNKKSGTADKYEIAPNPHNHTTRPHTHNLITGKSFIHTASKNWQIWIAGVNITSYLREQVSDIPNGWLGDKGEGIYPDTRLNDITHFYDILDVASVMDAEGRTADRDKLLAPEMKLVEIKSDAPFGVQAYLYMKLSTVNR